MTRRELMVIATMLAAMAEPAIAELRGEPKGVPNFTTDELLVISRNLALSEVVKIDPWVVRRLLDTLDRPSEHRTVSGRATEMQLPVKSSSELFDPKVNPDAERLQRASPEAVHDLFQLIKQAKDKKLVKPK